MCNAKYARAYEHAVFLHTILSALGLISSDFNANFIIHLGTFTAENASQAFPIQTSTHIETQHAHPLKREEAEVLGKLLTSVAAAKSYGHNNHDGHHYFDSLNSAYLLR